MHYRFWLKTLPLFALEMQTEAKLEATPHFVETLSLLSTPHRIFDPQRRLAHCTCKHRPRQLRRCRVLQPHFVKMLSHALLYLRGRGQWNALLYMSNRGQRTLYFKYATVVNRFCGKCGQKRDT